MEIMKEYLLWNVLLFKNYGQEVGGPVSPGPYGCCAYVCGRGESLSAVRYVSRTDEAAVRAVFYLDISWEKRPPNCV